MKGLFFAVLAVILLSCAPAPDAAAVRPRKFRDTLPPRGNRGGAGLRPPGMGLP
jgi:hypothetical protein